MRGMEVYKFIPKKLTNSLPNIFRIVQLRQILIEYTGRLLWIKEPYRNVSKTLGRAPILRSKYCLGNIYGKWVLRMGEKLI
jgi:hypothetical protein